MPLVLRDGYDAIAQAAVDVGCRFFTGYPMLPFTGLLDAFDRALEPAGGVMIQADTEIEGINMALGAVGDRRAGRHRVDRSGHRPDAGSRRRSGAQRVATRDLQHGAAVSRTTSSARGAAVGATTARSRSRRRAWSRPVEHTRLAFELADTWLTPVIVYGDTLIGFTQMTVEDDPIACRGAATAEAVGARRQHRRYRAVEGDLDVAARASTTHRARAQPPLGVDRRQVRAIAARVEAASRGVQRRRRRAPRGVLRHDRHRSSTTSSTSSGARGTRIGTFRPVTLWPFPSDALAEAAARAASRCSCTSSTPGR